jgi:hypothetical protein
MIANLLRLNLVVMGQTANYSIAYRFFFLYESVRNPTSRAAREAKSPPELKYASDCILRIRHPYPRNTHSHGRFDRFPPYKGFDPLRTDHLVASHPLIFPRNPCGLTGLAGLAKKLYIDSGADKHFARYEYDSCLRRLYMGYSLICSNFQRFWYCVLPNRISRSLSPVMGRRRSASTCTPRCTAGRAPTRSNHFFRCG